MEAERLGSNGPFGTATPTPGSDEEPRRPIRLKSLPSCAIEPAAAKNRSALLWRRNQNLRRQRIDRSRSGTLPIPKTYHCSPLYELSDSAQYPVRSPCMEIAVIAKRRFREVDLSIPRVFICVPIAGFRRTRNRSTPSSQPTPKISRDWPVKRR